MGGNIDGGGGHEQNRRPCSINIHGGGGHAQAAGASLPPEKGDEFIDVVDQLVADRLGL